MAIKPLHLVILDESAALPETACPVDARLGECNPPNSPLIAWTEERGGNYMQTPLLDNGLGYFCFDSGVLSVYKMTTGERQYQQRLGGGTSGFTSSPVAAGGHLYITNEEGHSYVLALRPGIQALGRKRNRRDRDGHTGDFQWCTLHARRQAPIRHRC
jgi:hypothetical protein